MNTIENRRGRNYKALRFLCVIFLGLSLCAKIFSRFKSDKKLN
jgi:hypothetical protein